MGLHGQLAHAEPEDPGEQRLGAVVAATELGHGSQAVQRQAELARPVEGDAELVGLGEGRLHLGGGEPAGGDQRRSPSDSWAASSAWSRSGPSGSPGSASSSASRCWMASRGALRPSACAAAARRYPTALGWSRPSRKWVASSAAWAAAAGP